ncbi:dolichyl-phosphate beta-glucosyltransferase [Dactylosporangium sp. NPDC048998]|uniref:dolichyl-phosphate beta-glucosyltransferase n=1 Tax=Dactylosporangium sp. NPDC048998 TaxID=3363976 RepID=UPI003716C902
MTAANHLSTSVHLGEVVKLRLQQRRSQDSSGPSLEAGDVGRSLIADVARPSVDLEVIIPAYNEEARIGATLQDVANQTARLPWSVGIVVVDNGSTDRTADVADHACSGLRVRVIGCSRQGKGAAVRRGILTSRARWVGFCDADSSTPADLIPRVAELLSAGHRIVVGSRYCSGGRLLVRQPLIRRLGSLGFRSLSRGMVGDLSDTQCGFKFFEATLARQLFTQSRLSGFAFDLELLALAHRSNIPITELPVDWTERGGSTLRLLRDGAWAYLELISLRLLGTGPGDPLALRPAIIAQAQARDRERLLAET